MKVVLHTLLLISGLFSVCTGMAQSLYPQGLFPLIHQAEDGRLSYTVGELAVFQYPNTLGPSLQAGYLPFVIAPLTVTHLYHSPGIDFSCTIYPNPTQSSLNLQFTDYDIPTLWANLYDINGSLIEKRSITKAPQIISWPVDHLSPGTYILSLTLSSGVVAHTFHWIKN